MTSMVAWLQSRKVEMLALLVGYVVLDLASYIHPFHGLNITPWNPAPALCVLLLLRHGKGAALPVGIAILVGGSLAHHLPASLPISIAWVTYLTLVYWGIAEILRRRLGGSAIFRNLSGMLVWAAIVAAGTLLNSLVFMSLLSFTGLIPASEWLEAILRYWVGDSVGILVTMPLFWMLLDDRSRHQLRLQLFAWESVGYVATTILVLWIAFGIGGSFEFKYLYVLYLPIAWAAARQGLAGAVLSAAIVQIGIIGAVQGLGFPTVEVFQIQLLALVLALCGFLVGVVIDEKQRLSAELRQTLRLAAAGEMAGALAHELNQPLTALSAYGSACEHLLAQGETGERLRTTIGRMVAESSRAADVLRRLRDFFRTGSTRLELIRLTDLIDSALLPFAEKAQQHGIALTVDPVPPCLLMADTLQLEVVLRNLLSNALEAVHERPREHRWIRLSARVESAGRACIQVEDGGEGITGAKAARLFEAFQSTKASGLGLGLAISRAIVDAHGGTLWAEVADHGLFKLVLPIEGKIENA